MNTLTTRKISGIVLFISGLLCIMFPLLGALNVEAMLGALILLSGIFHLVGVVEQKSAPDFIWGMLNSVVFLGVGIFLLADPYGGMQFLAVAIFFFLISHAFFTLGSAFSQKKSHPQWLWTIFSIFLTLAMATIIFFGYPGGNPWTIGMLAGVSMLGYGISLLVGSGVIQSEMKASPAKLKPAPKAAKRAVVAKKAVAGKKAATKKKSSPKRKTAAKKK